MLILLNPSLKSFREYMGYTTEPSNRVPLSRSGYFIICSTYKNYNSPDVYFAMLGNFIRFHTPVYPLKHVAIYSPDSTSVTGFKDVPDSTQEKQ